MSRQQHLPQIVIATRILNKLRKEMIVMIILKEYVNIICTPNIMKLQHLVKLLNTVRQQEVRGKSYSRMLRKECSSNSNMKQKRKQNCAEITKCMDIVNLVINAPTHMALGSFRRRHIYRVILWPNFVCNFIRMVSARMGRGANFYIVFMISKPIWPIRKVFVKVLDLLSRGIIKSAENHTPSASGPTWRPVMVAERQKDPVSHALRLFIIKTIKTTRE